MEDNKIKMDRDCIKFFVNPPSVNPTMDNLKEEIYKEAVRKAYKDMSSHTLHYLSDEYKGDKRQNEENRNELKSAIAEVLLKKENEIFCSTDQEAFNVCHKGLCKEIIEIFTQEREINRKSVTPINKRPGTLSDTKEEEEKEIQEKEHDSSFDLDKTFSYGQTQKLLNMAIKYVYLFYNYYNATEENKFHKELEEFKAIVNYLHMPIDGYVIKEIEIRAKGTKNCEGCDICSGKCRDITNKKFNGKVWSKFSYSDYRSFQKCVKKNLPDDKSVFLWELQNWPFGNNN